MAKLRPVSSEDRFTLVEHLSELRSRLVTSIAIFAVAFWFHRGWLAPRAVVMVGLLLVMAWVRHVYKDDPKGAVWLTSEQRSKFKPFDANAPHIEPAEELLPQCGGPAG